MNRILCILNLPPPFHGTSIINTYFTESEIIKKRFELEIINLTFSSSIQDIESFSFKKIPKFFIVGLSILKGLRSFNPNIVYYTNAVKGFAFYRDFLYVMLIKLTGKKIVFHMQGQGLKSRTDRNPIFRLLCKIMFSNTDIICLSQGLTGDVANFYTPKPYVVHNGIREVGTFKNVSGHRVNSIPVILYLSNFIRSKGLLVLIDALCELLNEGHQFSARLVGAPGDLSFDQVETILTAKGLSEHCAIIGPKYNDEKTQEFLSADLFILPTYYDAFPTVLIEAMQFGLPVISTYEGGIPEIVVDEQTGFLVEQMNAKQLAEKTGLLLKDKSQRQKMGEKGFERYQSSFKIERFEENMCNTLLTICDRHN